MRRAVCTYCTLRDGIRDRAWIRLELGDGTELHFCSIYCLSDWAAEHEASPSLRVTA